MMNRLRMLLVAAMIFMVSGCTEFKTVSRPELPQNKVTLTRELAALYHDVSKNAGFVDALDGYADIHVKTPKRDANLYCNLQVQRSKDARLIVSAGLFGWPVADMLIRKDSLFVHDMINNRMLVGTNSEENMEKIIGVQSGFTLLSESLLGLVTIPESERAIESVKQGAGKVSYMVRIRTGKKELIVNSADKVLEGVILYDTRGRTAVEVHFRNFETVTLKQQAVLVPREIDMTIHKYRNDESSENRMVIVYDKRVLNPTDFRIQYRRPLKARVVNIDEMVKSPWL